MASEIFGLKAVRIVCVDAIDTPSQRRVRGGIDIRTSIARVMAEIHHDVFPVYERSPGSRMTWQNDASV